MSLQPWHQIYTLYGLGLGPSAALASVPILTVLLLLGVLRRPAWVAGLAGLAATFALALAGYRMPVQTAVSAAAYGAAFGLFPISWIIFWAIVLFRVTVATGKFDIIRNSVGHLTSDPRLQALLIAFAFGAFLEGGAGFGTPVAIAAAMLTGLGFSAFTASAICLLANTAPVAFGSIGIPVITLAGTTGLPLGQLSAAVGRMCAPVSVFLPMYLIVAMGGFGSLSGVWVPAIAAGVAFASVQLLVSTLLGPQLTDILAALSAIAVLIAYLRLRRTSLGAMAAYPAFDMGGGATSTPMVAPAEPAVPYAREPVREVLYAWLPYALLVLCVLLWGFVPFQGALNRASVLVPWPLLHDLVLRMPPVTLAPSAYHAVFTFNFLSASGTSCMVATLLSAVCLGMRPRAVAEVLLATVRQLALPIMTVAVVLAIGFLMNYSGATATLGLAFASTGRLFPFFSSMLGCLGVFLTGSDTSSNALFGSLQVVTANRLGLNPVLMAATNSAGGVMGKMISLQTIAVAAAATGLSAAEQSRLFRFTLKHSLFLACVIGCLSMVYAYVVKM